MRILAIDPSPDKHAWVMWDTETHDFFGERMGLDIAHDSPQSRPDFVAIEFPQSYGINAGMSLFATAYNAGKLAMFCETNDVQVFLFGRPSIKGADRREKRFRNSPVVDDEARRSKERMQAVWSEEGYLGSPRLGRGSR